MTADAIRSRRLRASRLAGPPFADPVEAVRYLTAVQSQDYPAAAWAIAQRTVGATATGIDDLFDRGLLLRTHVLRPTWHFVLPADIRWLLALTARRVHMAAAYQYRRVGLDDEVFAQSHAVLARALESAGHLTRAELRAALHTAGIETDGLRFGLLVMAAELDGVICSGPRRGRHFTYALLDERAPNGRTMTDRDEALAELARRYIVTHGPAQARDVAWWSGLTVSDVRRGLDAARPAIEPETIDGRVFWSAAGDDRSHGDDGEPKVHLLPNFDEYTVAYADRSHIVAGSPLEGAPSADLLANVVVLDGRPIGHWQRTLQGDEVIVTTRLLVELDPAGRGALEAAAQRYGRFLGLSVRLA